jgi:hypothetical protein
LDKNQRAEIAIARDEDTPLLASNAKQLGIIRLRQAKPCDGNHIMPQVSQETNGKTVNVLVGKKLHGVVAR